MAGFGAIASALLGGVLGCEPELAMTAAAVFAGIGLIAARDVDA